MTDHSALVARLDTIIHYCGHDHFEGESWDVADVLREAIAALTAPPVPEGDTQQIRAWLDEHMPDCRPITLAQRVINELSDYERFLEDASVVYDHITHGAISKPNTTARSVISVADDVVTGLVEEEIASRWQAFRAQIEGLRWVRGLPEGCREAGDGWLAALDAVLDAMKGVRRAAPAVWEKP